MKFKCFVLASVFLFTNTASAEVLITAARVKSPIPGQTLSAGYFDLKNIDNETISIIGVSSDSASRVEMHTHVMENGMMGMVQLQTLEIEGGESLSFIEGGHHLMIFDPDQITISSGEFDFVFEFDDGTKLEVIASVESFLK